MKKALTSILAVFLIITCLTGCGRNTITFNVHVEGAIFSGNSEGSIAEELKFNPSWLIKGNNTKYNKDLALFAALLSADTYFREKDLAKGTQNRVLIDGLNVEEYTWTTMLSELGFTDVSHIESFSENESETDVNDSVVINLGYMQSGDTDIYVAAFRGCFSSGEWVSAFDLGADCDEYIAHSGEHHDWTNKDNLKGFDVAASRAMQLINSFVSEHEAAGRNSCILVTGHSRGASLAQIVGAYLEKSDIKSFTYTFNSLPCTNDPAAEEYASIFNIVDDDDFFGSLFPFADEPLYRYGKTLHGYGKNDAVNTDLISEYTELFQRKFSNRASLYETKRITGFYDDTSGKAAEARADEVGKIISSEFGLDLEDLCSVSCPDDCEINIEYCDAAEIHCLGKVLTYGSTAAELSKNLFETDPDFCAMIDLIMDHSADITSGHLLKNTLDLSQSF